MGKKCMATITFRFCGNMQELLVLRERLMKTDFIDWAKKNKPALTSKEREEQRIAARLFEKIKENNTIIKKCKSDYYYDGPALQSTFNSEYPNSNDVDADAEIMMKYLPKMFPKNRLGVYIKLYMDKRNMDSLNFEVGFTKELDVVIPILDYRENTFSHEEDGKIAKPIPKELAYCNEFETDFSLYNEKLDAFKLKGNYKGILSDNSYVPASVFRNEKGIIESGKGHIRRTVSIGDFLNENGKTAKEIGKDKVDFTKTVATFNGANPQELEMYRERLSGLYQDPSLSVYLFLDDNIFDTDMLHYDASGDVFTTYSANNKESFEVPGELFKDENGEFVDKQVPFKRNKEYYFVHFTE